MAMNSFVGAFNTGTGTSDVVVTDPGFQPKLIVFWWSGRTETTDTVGGTDLFRGFGWTIGTNAADNHSVCGNQDDGNTLSDANSAHSSSACILSVSFTNTIDGALALKSFDSNGFTLQVNDAFPRDSRIHYLALGGDITNLATGEEREGTTANFNTTAPGFQPDLVMFMTTNVSNAAPAAISSGGAMGFGCATSSAAASQWAWAGTTEGAGIGTSDAASYCLQGECMAWLPSTASTVVDGRCAFLSMDTNGFTIDFLEGIGTRRWHWLAVKGGQYRVENLTTSLTLDADLVETGFGFTPTAALFVSHAKAASLSNNAQNNDELSFGAFSSLTNRGVQATTETDAATVMLCGNAVEHDCVYLSLTQVDATTVDGRCDIQSIDSDGFTLNQTTADPVASFVGYIAFGSSPVTRNPGRLSLLGAGHGR